MKAFWVLGIDRTVQNRVGAGDYGFYFSLFSFSVLFNILLDFGITNYNNRKIAVSPGLLNGMLGNLFVIRFGFAVIYMIISLVAAWLLGYRGHQVSLLLVLLANQFLASFILYLRSNITALHMFRLDSLISVTDRFIMIVVCSLLLWSGITGTEFRIEWFVYSQTFAYLLTFLIALAVVMSKSGMVRFTFSGSQVRSILKESAPYAMLSMFMAVYWRVDTVMIERMMNDGQAMAGIYAQAFRLLDAASMIPYLFAVILLPMFSKGIAGGVQTNQLARFAATLLLIPATIVAVISVAYPVDIMKLLYHEHIGESAAVFSILMAAYLPVAMVYIYSTILTAGGKLSLLNRITGAGMIMNILLNLVLIPRMGARGSATASVVTQVLMALLFYNYASKLVNSERPLRFGLSVVFNAIMLIIASLLFRRAGLGLLTGGSLLLLTGTATPLISGMLNLAEIKVWLSGMMNK